MVCGRLAEFVLAQPSGDILKLIAEQYRNSTWQVIGDARGFTAAAAPRTRTILSWRASSIGCSIGRMALPIISEVGKLEPWQLGAIVLSRFSAERAFSAAVSFGAGRGEFQLKPVRRRKGKPKNQKQAILEGNIHRDLRFARIRLGGIGSCDQRGERKIQVQAGDPDAGLGKV